MAGWNVSRPSLASDGSDGVLQCLWEGCIHPAREETQRHLLSGTTVYKKFSHIEKKLPQ